MDLKNLMGKIREPKVSRRFCQILVISNKKIHRLGYRFKISRKSIV
jgi:hypothetical protein